MDDGEYFEPNLFRDINQEDSKNKSSPREAHLPLHLKQQSPRNLGSENAKIIALLQAGRLASHDIDSTKARSSLKVTFEESISTSQEKDLDPFLPDSHQDQNPHLSSMLSSLMTTPGSARLISSASTSNSSRKRPRTIETYGSSVSENPLCFGGPGKTPVHSVIAGTMSTSCSTPLSRLIELYEHDGDNEDRQDESFDSGSNCDASPTSASILQMMQTCSPPSLTSDRSCNGQFFTFDTTHINSDPQFETGHLAQVTSAGTTAKNVQLQSYPNDVTCVSHQHFATDSENEVVACKVGIQPILSDNKDSRVNVAKTSSNDTLTAVQVVRDIKSNKEVADLLEKEMYNHAEISRKPSTISEGLPLLIPNMSQSRLPPCTAVMTTSCLPPASFEALFEKRPHIHDSDNVSTSSVITQDVGMTKLSGMQANVSHDSVVDNIDYSEDTGEDPSLESICRWVCQRFCPNNSATPQCIEISTLAPIISCSPLKIRRVFCILDSCKVVRKTEITPLTYTWLHCNRSDLMTHLEIIFADMQRDELNAQNTDRMLLIGREFLEGVKSLHLTLEAEAAEGNVNCLKKNRSENFALDWMERNVVNRILMRKLLAEVLIGNNSHCHPLKDVPDEFLHNLSIQSGVNMKVLRRRLSDITSVLSGLDVLQRIPILSFLPRTGSSVSSSSVHDDFKTTFRWIFPLDYISIYYRQSRAIASPISLPVVEESEKCHDNTEHKHCSNGGSILKSLLKKQSTSKTIPTASTHST